MGLAIVGVIVVVAFILLILVLVTGIRIIRPTHRGLVERLGKYHRYCDPGFHIIIPVIERM